MNPTHSIHRTCEIAAPATAIWERICDHANTHTWVLPARVRLLQPGTPAPNGLGAMRQVSFPEKRMWGTIEERVTAFDAPRSFSYTITKGMGGLKGHLGTVSVEALDDKRSLLTWHVDFEFSPWHPMGWIASPFTRTFGKLLQQALDELARQMSR